MRGYQNVVCVKYKKNFVKLTYNWIFHQGDRQHEKTLLLHHLYSLIQFINKYNLI